MESKELRAAVDSLSPAEKKQLLSQVQELGQQFTKANEKIRKAAKKLRQTADYLDEVYRDCKIASATGSGASIVGGLLTIGGGVASLMTAGAASPLLIAGLSITLAGAGTNLGTAAVEAIINSSQIKDAQSAVDEAQTAIAKVNDIVENWRSIKNKTHLLYLVYQATAIFGDVGVDILKHLLQPFGLTVESMAQVGATTGEAAAQVSSRAGEGATEAAGKAAGKAVSKTAAKAMVVLSAAFVVWDTIDLAFTIRDLVQHKGSQAAKLLRQKADEMEASTNTQN